MKKQGQKPSEQALRVAAYLRVSTDEQAESGLGLGAQEQKIRAMCIIKDWPVPTFYIDAGVTGTVDLPDRPEGARLLEDIDAGKVDAVIVSSLDRLGRKAVYILNFVDRIDEAVLLISCKETIDTTTATGKFVLRMFAALAELERDTISERTVAALEQRGREVGIKAGLPPYGYRYEAKEVFIVPVEAEVVRQVFDLRSQGLTLRAIAAQTPLSFNAVKKVLDRKHVYLGGLRGDSQHTWPVILAA